ncbi:hypothetical protein CVIRNUC_006978 [Coccomyxa viridis]|uniref:Protein arginine N-methyltransferase domain-containing protein n=1 Tax=Coccomyxa viridis TaxID=1274662 RepID=A0AAV1ID26_9CHLO|nr:hypothetical protein CVIRNUC_006978 [Coccomyxa viridis]
MAAQLNGAPVPNGGTDSSAAMHATNGLAPPKISDLDGKAPAPSDWANYFCTYAYLYHQKDMLEDHKRTGAYYQAVMQNRRQFEGKVVLDVGTGSGILAIFAAKAGARKVYAVEATPMAKFAQNLVEHNELGGVVEVIQGTIETVSLPEKVDIIISEWMGYFLLRESMLDSVLVARDRFLKPGGALYPSHARLYLALMRSQNTQQRVNDFQGAMEGWADFAQDMRHFYGVDMNCLDNSYRREQKEYYLETSAWADIHPSQLLGPACCFKEYDLLHVTLEELAAPLQEKLRLDVLDGGPVEGLVGFFDVQFRGSPQNPADFPVSLSTAPDPTGATHWGQQTFCLHPPIDCAPGDAVEGSIRITRKKENHRLMQVIIDHKVTGSSLIAQASPQRTSLYHIE